MPKVVTLSSNSKSEATPLMVVLNSLMEKNNLNMAQLSKNTGLTFTTIKRLCADPACNPTLGSIDKIAKFFGVKSTQLMGIEPINSDAATGYHPDFSGWVNIPIISQQQLLSWPNQIDEIRASKSTQFVKTDLEINEKMFALKATDESLEPKFSAGTVLIFDPEKQYRNKDYVALHIHGKELPQIRQIFIDGSDIYIKTINPEFSGNQPTKLDKNSFMILGVLIQARSNYF